MFSTSAQRVLHTSDRFPTPTTCDWTLRRQPTRISVATSIHSSGNLTRSIRLLPLRFSSTCTTRNGPFDRVLHVLKPGGVCIASTRFLYRYHPDPKDYYRFTWDSLEYLFRRFSHVEVHHHGSRVQAIWEMINAGGRSRVLLNILNPFFALFEFQQTQFPLWFVIYAQK